MLISGEEIAKFKNQADQGDVHIRRIEKLPDGLVKVEPSGGRFIISHSETGHEHFFRARQGMEFFNDPKNLNVCYLKIDGLGPEYLTHDKVGPQRHATVEFTAGNYKFNRQRENGPQGWRAVRD